MRLILLLTLLVILFSCESKRELVGPWRGVILLQGQELPMNFEIRKNADQYEVILKNADEEIVLDEIILDKDSIIMYMHIFDTEIHAKINGKTMLGYYVKNYEKDFLLPFIAVYGNEFRFVESQDQAEENFEGKYTVQFIHEFDTVHSVGIFSQQGNKLTGTFLNPTGDYRYLQGNVVDGQLNLSTFDGNHAFVFKASKNADGTLAGDFWSGNEWHESWTGIRDDNASLADAETLTYLKAGYDRLDFSFPDLSGNLVSPDDGRFKNKVVVMQIVGTWCPNCMDETKFLSQWYMENRDRGVEILGLAYEAKDDFAYASGRVKKMIEKLNVPYDFVIAGNKDKKQAAETLPMLNHVISFPTTIFIGKDGAVKRIHTGFTGPGTGIYYDQFIESFNKTIDELLNEN